MGDSSDGSKIPTIEQDSLPDKLIRLTYAVGDSIGHEVRTRSEHLTLVSAGEQYLTGATLGALAKLPGKLKLIGVGATLAAEGYVFLSNGYFEHFQKATEAINGILSSKQDMESKTLSLRENFAPLAVDCGALSFGLLSGHLISEMGKTPNTSQSRVQFCSQRTISEPQLSKNAHLGAESAQCVLPHLADAETQQLLKNEFNEVIPKSLPKLLPSLVQIKSKASYGQHTLGSGFVVDSLGLVATNKHCVSERGTACTVRFSDGRTYQAQSVWEHDFKDIAIVKILPKSQSERFTAAEISENINQYDFRNQPLMAVGVLGETRQIHVAPSKFKTLGEPKDLRYQGEVSLQTLSGVFPGFSGGPLIDSTGKVMGMSKAIDCLENSTYSVLATDIAESIREAKKSQSIWTDFNPQHNFDGINNGIKLEYKLRNPGTLGLNEQLKTATYGEDFNQVEFQKALALKALADSAGRKGNHREAVSLYERAYKYMPCEFHTSSFLENYGDALYYTNRYPEAALKYNWAQQDLAKEYGHKNADILEKRRVTLSLKEAQSLLQSRPNKYDAYLSGYDNQLRLAYQKASDVLDVCNNSPEKIQALIVRGDAAAEAIQFGSMSRHGINEPAKTSLDAYAEALRLTGRTSQRQVADILFKMSLVHDQLAGNSTSALRAYRLKTGALNILDNKEMQYSPAALPILNELLSRSTKYQIPKDLLASYHAQRIKILERQYGPNSPSVAEALFEMLKTETGPKSTQALNRLIEINKHNFGNNPTDRCHTISAWL